MLATAWTDPVPLTTAALAIVTLGLVLVTRGVAQQTRDVAKQTRDATLAGHRPLLADVPVGQHLTASTIPYGYETPDAPLDDVGAMHIDAVQDGRGWVVVRRSVAVRNVGNGPARVERVELEILDEPDVAPEEQPRTRSVPFIIPAGDVGRLITSVNYGYDGDLDMLGGLALSRINFRIGATYTDVAGEQRQRVTIRSRIRSLHGTVIEQDPEIEVENL